jgi:hypothetical protein
MPLALLGLLPLGLAAGILTTVSGLGGGQMLVLVLSVIWDPRRALVTSAPALLLGNLHRLVIYRKHIDRPIALAFVAGALPGALAGGLLAVTLPLWLMHVFLISATLIAVAKAFGLWSFKPPAAAITPVGLGIGAVCATSSGAGLLTSPVLLSAGLTGRAYVATSACAAAAMHIGRLSGYGAGGLVGVRDLAHSAVLACAILAGNHLGERVEKKIGERTHLWLDHGTLVACVALAVLGAAR